MNSSYLNLSILIAESELEYLRSFQTLEFTRKMSIYTTVLLTFFGLIGNFIIIFVFGQSRFRTNSSNVYLLCLAVNDSCFFIVHFFEVKNFLFVINYAFFQPSKSYFKKIYSNFSKTMLNG